MFYYQLIRHMPEYILTNFAIPQTGSKPSFDDISSSEPAKTSGEQSSVSKFLQKLLGSENLHTQLARLRYLDQDTKSKLKNTILANEPFIAYCHIKYWIEEVRVGSRTTGFFVFQGCKELARSVRHGSETEKIWAKFLSHKFLQSNRYFKNAMQSTLAHHQSRNSQLCRTLCMWGSSGLPGEQKTMHTRSQSKIIELIRLVNEGTCHFPDQIPREMAPRSCASCSISKNNNRKKGTFKLTSKGQRMTIDLDRVSFIEVDVEHKPLDLSGHFPVFAEHVGPGEEKYVALVSDRVSQDVDSSGLPSIIEHNIFIAIENGARIAKFNSCCGQTKTTTTFYMMVLRHDPMDALPPYPSIPKDAADPTGPLYWMPEGENIIQICEDIGVEEREGNVMDGEPEDNKSTNFRVVCGDQNIAEGPKNEDEVIHSVGTFANIFPVWDLIPDEGNAYSVEMNADSEPENASWIKFILNGRGDLKLNSADHLCPSEEPSQDKCRIQELENLLVDKESKLKERGAQLRRAKEEIENLKFWNIVRSMEGISRSEALARERRDLYG
ncbi:hypothetical protein SCHPADRAFT_891252 [Schizopora paradoxa]|uniref:Uncharacterized protein n=1 Tax=Schizopora paradoxa TaxID=27342 RepID=A0A0H2RQX5_9AGAM|nr:hypothetical protein SCHPADRAFT_891252 [Schizopora paradoxa]